MDNNKPTIPGTPSAQQPRPRIKPGTFWLIAGMLVLLTLLLFSRGNGNRSEITYDFFWKQLQADNLSEVTFDNQSLVLGRFKKVPKAPPKPAASSEDARWDNWFGTSKREPLQQNFSVVIPPVEDRELIPTLREKGILVKADAPSDSNFIYLVAYLFVPLLLLGGLWLMLRRTRDQFLGGGILSAFTKSPAKR